MKNLLLLHLFAFTAHSVMGQAPPDLPIEFGDPAINYNIIGFGGAGGSLAPSPTDPADEVLCGTKPAGSDCWGGVTVGDACLANPIPFAAGNMTMYMDIYSPAAGMPILMKVEQCGNAAVYGEVLVVTTAANAW